MQATAAQTRELLDAYRKARLAVNKHGVSGFPQALGFLERAVSKCLGIVCGNCGSPRDEGHPFCQWCQKTYPDRARIHAEGFEETRR